MSLHKVVEVREGQNTEMFDKFPYEQVEKQSFSLVYQQEGKFRYKEIMMFDESLIVSNRQTLCLSYITQSHLWSTRKL